MVQMFSFFIYRSIVSNYKKVGFFLMRFEIFHADMRNNSSRFLLLRRLPRSQDTQRRPSNSIQHTCHLGGHPSKYYLGPTLLDLSAQMGTGMSNVGRVGAGYLLRREGYLLHVFYILNVSLNSIAPGPYKVVLTIVC
jgi:hypothetical protein